MSIIDNIYGSSSNYLKAADLQGKKPVLTIASAALQENTYNGEKKTQIVLHFEESEKVLGLNKTNARRIAALIQTESFEDWAGYRIKLFTDQTEFDGKTVDCIRVWPDLPEQVNEKARAAAASANDESDIVPF